MKWGTTFLNYPKGGHPMRGEDHQQTAMFSYISPEQRVPANHPLRKLRPLVDAVLTPLCPTTRSLQSRMGYSRAGVRFGAHFCSSRGWYYGAMRLAIDPFRLLLISLAGW